MFFAKESKVTEDFMNKNRTYYLDP